MAPPIAAIINYICLLYLSVSALMVVTMTGGGDDDIMLPYRAQLDINWLGIKSKVDVDSEVPMLSKLNKGRWRRSSEELMTSIHSLSHCLCCYSEKCVTRGASRQGDYGVGTMHVDNWTVIKVVPISEGQLEVMFKMMEVQEYGVNFLREPHNIDSEINILLSEPYFQKYKYIFETHNITYEIIEEHIHEREYKLEEPEFGIAGSRKQQFLPYNKDNVKYMPYAKESLSLSVEEQESRISGSRKQQFLPYNEDNVKYMPYAEELLSLSMEEPMEPPERRRTTKLRKFKTDDADGAGSLDWQYFKTFHSLDENIKRWRELEKRFRKFLRLETIAETFYGKPVFIFKIGFKMFSDPNSNDRPIILIDALHQAREWATLSTSSYIIEKILSDLESGIVGPVLRTFDFLIIPMVNPDGYHHSYTKERFWRKNRKHTGPPGPYNQCIGIDLIRNYPVAGEEHDDYNKFGPCSNYYPGTPLDQPESKGVDSVMHKFGRQIKMYLNLRSYGKQLELPNLENNSSPKNVRYRKKSDRDLANTDGKALRSAAVTFINLVNYYNQGPNKFKLARSLGTSLLETYKMELLDRRFIDKGNPVDHAHRHHNIKYTFAISLPPAKITKKNLGFFLSKEEILPVAHETYLGIMGLAEKLHHIPMN